MTTVAPSADVRGQALAIIARTLGSVAGCLDRRLGEFEGAVVGDFLADIDVHFGIAIEADLKATIADLLDLVETMVQLEGGGRFADPAPSNIIAWDDERARRGLPLYAPKPRPHRHPIPVTHGPSLTAVTMPDAAPANPSPDGRRRGCETFPPQTRGSYPFPAEPEPFVERAPIVAPIVAPIRLRAKPPRLVFSRALDLFRFAD